MALAGASPALAGGPPPVIPVAPGVGYGPQAAAPVPGGFARVVTSRVICQAGGVIGPVKVDGLRATLTVPRGAFPLCLQVTLTEPDVAGIGNGGFSCFHAIGGVGVIVQRPDGTAYRPSFLKPLPISLTAASISKSSLVAAWNGTGFVTVRADVGQGFASVQISKAPAFLVVLNPTCGAKGVVPGATGAGTGKPFLGEGVLAGVLVLAGAGGITLAHRRKRAGSGPAEL